MKKITLTDFERKLLRPVAWPIWVFLRKIMPRKQADSLYQQILTQ
jgi:hypothetical protein